MTYPVHEKPDFQYDFERLNMLWQRHPKYHEMTTFTTLEALLEEHEKYREEFEEVREEYIENDNDKFLIHFGTEATREALYREQVELLHSIIKKRQKLL